MARTNVVQTVKMVRDRSLVLDTAGKITIVGAMYDVASGQVVLVWAVTGKRQGGLRRPGPQAPDPHSKDLCREGA